jgi:hypothetical protein
MIMYQSFYTIAYLGCPLGFQAFARGLRGGLRSAGDWLSRFDSLSTLRFDPKGSAWFMHAIVLFGNETDQILTNEQNIPHCPFCCLCALPPSASALTSNGWATSAGRRIKRG